MLQLPLFWPFQSIPIDPTKQLAAVWAIERRGLGLFTRIAEQIYFVGAFGKQAITPRRAPVAQLGFGEAEPINSYPCPISKSY